MFIEPLTHQSARALMVLTNPIHRHKWTDSPNAYVGNVNI